MMTTVNRQPDMTIEQQAEDTRWVKKLPKLLRSFGTMAILASLYLFLVKGWEGSGDLVRYLMLLGHTGALTAIALFSGHYLKEGKGARLLLMLALVSVVVNFAILGAFIMAETTGIDTQLHPQYLVWSTGSMEKAVATTGIATLLLLPIVWFGFRSLARGMSNRMSALFIISNFALLMPLRDPVLIAITAILLGLYTLYVTARTSRQGPEAKTLEGVVVIMLQFLPLTVMLGRNIWLYSADYSLYTAASIMAFIAVRQCTLYLTESSFFRKLLELSSLGLALMTCGFAYTAMIGGLHESVAIIVSCLIASGMCYEISFRAKTSVGMYRFIAVAITVAGVICNLLVHGSVAASVLALSTGILSISVSYILQHRALFSGGVIMVIAGSVDQFMQVFQFFDFGYWVTLAIFGTVAIVFGSLLESKGNQIKERIHALRNNYAEWSY